MTISTSHVHIAIAMIVLMAVATATAQAPATVPEPVPGTVEEWIGQLDGGWAGNDNLTPLGNMPFAFVFERDGDGALHAHTALNAETYVDLRFHRDADGGWLFTEEGSLQGLGKQSYTMVPDGSPSREAMGSTLEWIYLPKPEFLRARLTVNSENLDFLVFLRDEEHVHFRLARLDEKAASVLRESLAAAAALAPSETPALEDVARQTGSR